MGWVKSLFERNVIVATPTKTFNSAEGIDGDPIALEQYHNKLIGSAIENGHEIKFDYAKPESGTEERNVIPGSIGGGYFNAFCLDRQAWRKFKVDRIVGKVKGTKPASINPPADPQPIPQRSPSAGGASRIKVNQPANEGVNPGNEIHELFGVGGTNKNSALVNIFGRFTSRYPKKEDGSTPTGNEIELRSDRRSPEDDRQFISDHEHDNDKPDLTVEPSQSDYNEIRKLDVDPDTHDKATYKRIRSMGVPHHKCVAAAADGCRVPFGCEVSRDQRRPAPDSACRDSPPFFCENLARICEKPECKCKPRGTRCWRSLPRSWSNSWSNQTTKILYILKPLRPIVL